MTTPPTPGEAILLIGLLVGMFNATPGQLYGADVLVAEPTAGALRTLRRRCPRQPSTSRSTPRR